LRNEPDFSPSRRPARWQRQGISGRRQDGTIFAIEVSLSPLESASGARLVMATVHDITQRKQMAAALMESESRMRAIFDTASTPS